MGNVWSEQIVPKSLACLALVGLDDGPDQGHAGSGAGGSADADIPLFAINPSNPDALNGRLWNSTRKSLTAAGLPFLVVFLNDKPFGLTVGLKPPAAGTFLISLSNERRHSCTVVGAVLA